MTTTHEEQHSRHPTFMQYVMIAIILFVVTMVEFLLIYDKVGIDDDLGAAKVPLLIAMSAFKFGVVIMFYMHLKFDSKLFTWIFLGGLGLAFAVGIALLGIFVTLQGEPREFAQANAVPYVEEGHEPEGEEHIQRADDAAKPADTSAVGGHYSEAEASESDAGQATLGGPLQISVTGDSLQFDNNSLTASAGSEVVLTFNNSSTINQHNWVLVRGGTKDEVATDGAIAGPGNDWIPLGDPRILAHTTLLNPGETQEIRFTVDAGTYQFVCTFPGHNLTMFGDFEVAP